MSHELRTPLNAILGFSEVIRDELFGPVGLDKYVDYASDVHKSGQLLLDLINDVLDLSKIDAGKVELREEILRVPELIRDCIVLVRERALKAGVALTLLPIAPEPQIAGDARLLKQVLLNLLSNAVKFTPQGGSVTVTAVARRDDYIITVSDTGIGMSPEDIQVAMSAYGQVDSKIASKHRGTGLGLPISRSLAELDGGALNIKKACWGTAPISSWCCRDLAGWCAAPRASAHKPFYNLFLDPFVKVRHDPVMVKSCASLEKSFGALFFLDGRLGGRP